MTKSHIARKSVQSFMHLERSTCAGHALGCALCMSLLLHVQARRQAYGGQHNGRGVLRAA